MAVVFAGHGDDGADAPSACRAEKAAALDVDEISDVSPSGEYFLGEAEGEDRLVRKGEKPVELLAVLADAFGGPWDRVDIPYHSPRRVNSFGAAIGIADVPLNEDSHRLTDVQWLCQDGKVTELELPAEYDPREWDLTLPLTWGTDSYNPTILDQAESASTFANAVNGDGVIVGKTDYHGGYEDVVTESFLWHCTT